MTIALVIDAKAKTITKMDVEGYQGIRKIIGGTLTAVRLPEGHVYVDDEGLLKKSEHFFCHADYPQPLAGNGVVFGGADDEGDDLPFTGSVEDFQKKITFMTSAEFQKWISAHADETCSGVYSLGNDGRVVATETSWGQMFGDLNKP